MSGRRRVPDDRVLFAAALALCGPAGVRERLDDAGWQRLSAALAAWDALGRSPSSVGHAAVIERAREALATDGERHAATLQRLWAAVRDRAALATPPAGAGRDRQVAV